MHAYWERVSYWLCNSSRKRHKSHKAVCVCVWSNRNIMQNYYHFFYFLELSLSEILSEKYCVQKQQRGFHYLFMYLGFLYYILCKMDGSFAKFFLQEERAKKGCYIYICVHVILYNSSNNIFFMRKWMESSCLLVWLARETVRCAFCVFLFESQGRVEKVCIQGIYILCVFVVSANLQHTCFKNHGVLDLLGCIEWRKAGNIFYKVEKRVLSIERLSNVIDCVIIPCQRSAPSRGWKGKSLKGCFSKGYPCLFQYTPNTMTFCYKGFIK